MPGRIQSGRIRLTSPFLGKGIPQWPALAWTGYIPASQAPCQPETTAMNRTNGSNQPGKGAGVRDRARYQS